MNWCLIIGILLNCVLIVVNRFIYKLPDKIQFPLLILGIVLLIIGLVKL
ncbi:MAG: hypothetical protein IKT56_01720 [Clostridia bacterium]|nr:hypothetical protein [Clostridia bacterium]